MARKFIRPHVTKSMQVKSRPIVDRLSCPCQDHPNPTLADVGSVPEPKTHVSKTMEQVAVVRQRRSGSVRLRSRNVERPVGFVSEVGCRSEAGRSLFLVEHLPSAHLQYMLKICSINTHPCDS
jgi:hypothetical protein